MGDCVLNAPAPVISSDNASTGRTARDAAEDDSFVNLRERFGRLSDRLRIAVIYNGDKDAPGAVIHPTHNPRSNKSYEPVAADIAASLRSSGFRHVSVLPDDMRLGERLRQEGIDFAWVNSAGVQGYGAVSHTPGTLEMLGIPYVGHNPLNAVTLDNKHAFKRGLLSLGLPTAPFVIWDGTSGPFLPARSSLFQRTFEGFAGRFVVKPVSGRASQHIHVVDRAEDLTEAVDTVYRATANTVLVESYMPGAEYCVSVSGGVAARQGVLSRQRDPFVFSAIQRLLGPDETIFTSMDVRPITLDRTRLLDPAADAGAHAALVRLAKRVYLDFQLRSLVRVDVRSDDQGRLFVLEANPKPDLARPRAETYSLVCVGLHQCGMSYDDLILSLFADRMDFYLRHRPRTIAHVQALMQ